MNDFVPLLMNDKVIGRITVNLETGEFSGGINAELTGMLREGIDGEVLSVALQYIYGRSATQDMSAQNQIAEYLNSSDDIPIEGDL